MYTVVVSVGVLDVGVDILEKADEVDGETVVIGVIEEDLECMGQPWPTFPSSKHAETSRRNLPDC